MTRWTLTERAGWASVAVAAAVAVVAVAAVAGPSLAFFSTAGGWARSPRLSLPWEPCPGSPLSPRLGGPEPRAQTATGCKDPAPKRVTDCLCGRISSTHQRAAKANTNAVLRTHNVTRRNSSGRRTHREATANAVLQTHNVTRRNSSGRRTHREATANAVFQTHNVTRRKSSGRRTHREATANAVLQTHNVTRRNSSGRKTHREATANAASGESDSPGIRWSALAPGGFLGPGGSNRERGVTNTQRHKAKLIWSQNSPRSYCERV